MANRFQSVDKESYWRWHIDVQAAGSVSIRAYCGKHGLSEPSFYAWRRKIQNQDAGQDSSSDSQPESQALTSAGRSRVRSEGPGHQQKSRSGNRHPSVPSKVHSLQPSSGTGLVALDIIGTANPILEIEGPGGVVIRLREDVSKEALQRVIAACQVNHSAAAGRGEERSC